MISLKTSHLMLRILSPNFSAETQSKLLTAQFHLHGNKLSITSSILRGYGALGGSTSWSDSLYCQFTCQLEVMLLHLMNLRNSRL